MSPEKSEPQQSLFAPPASEVLTAEDLAKPPERRGRMIVLGLLFGILLWMQWIRLPFAWIKPVVPALRPLVKSSPGDLGYHVGTAILGFLSSVPNTLILTLIAVVAIRKAGYARATLYATLVWPLLIFVSHWLRLMSRMNVATRLGWNPSEIANIERTDFAAPAVLIVLIYGSFLLLSVVLLRVLGRSGSCPTRRA